MQKKKMEEFRYRCKTCKQLFSCEVGWREHKDWMITCGRLNCICDVFSYAKYKHSINSIENKPYGRTFKTNELIKLEEVVELTMKQPELI